MNNPHVFDPTAGASSPYAAAVAAMNANAAQSARGYSRAPISRWSGGAPSPVRGLGQEGTVIGQAVWGYIAPFFSTFAVLWIARSAVKLIDEGRKSDSDKQRAQDRVLIGSAVALTLVNEVLIPSKAQPGERGFMLNLLAVLIGLGAAGSLALTAIGKGSPKRGWTSVRKKLKKKDKGGDDSETGSAPSRSSRSGSDPMEGGA